MTQISRPADAGMTANDRGVPRAFSRNIGWLNPDEQAILGRSVVAIAGAGGDGGELAVQLARLGVGEIRLADPDEFEIENLNRQACCTVDTVGTNKALAVGTYLQAINPDIKVTVYTDGVTARNVEHFMAGADLVIDETEFTLHAIGVMIARQARKQGIPDLMTLNVGFGSHTTTYNPRGRTLEATLGLSETASLEEIAAAEVPLTRWLATLPEYAHLDVFKRVASDKAGDHLDVPTVSPGVASAASTAAVQAVLSLLNGANKRPKPVYAPNVIVNDVMSLETRVIRHSRFSTMWGLLRMATRTWLRRNPRAV